MVLKILMGVIQHDMTLTCVCPAGYKHYQLHCMMNITYSPEMCSM